MCIAYTCVCMPVCTRAYLCVYACVNACVCAYNVSVHVCIACTCVWVCVCLCECVCMHISVCTSVYACKCVYAYKCLCVCVHMRVCVVKERPRGIMRDSPTHHVGKANHRARPPDPGSGASPLRLALRGHERWRAVGVGAGEGPFTRPHPVPPRGRRMCFLLHKDCVPGGEADPDFASDPKQGSDAKTTPFIRSITGYKQLCRERGLRCLEGSGLSRAVEVS